MTPNQSMRQLGEYHGSVGGSKSPETLAQVQPDVEMALPSTIQRVTNVYSI